MSEWYVNQKKQSSNFRKLLQERIEIANQRRELTTEEAKRLSKLKKIAEKLKRGEPIICSPTDAFKCFMGTELDLLAVGNYVLYKEQQDEALKENYEERYELD